MNLSPNTLLHPSCPASSFICPFVLHQICILRFADLGRVRNELQGEEIRKEFAILLFHSVGGL
jgi:hypothetical protein